MHSRRVVIVGVVLCSVPLTVMGHARAQGLLPRAFIPAASRGSVGFEPGKAPPTPTKTLEPVRTPSVTPTSTLTTTPSATRTATSTRTPRPTSTTRPTNTAVPTSTPRVKPGCNEILENGGFEAGIAPWEVLGQYAAVETWPSGSFEGVSALRLAAADGESVSVRAPKARVFRRREVSKITVSFGIRVSSRETIRHGDFVMVGLEASNQSDCKTPCRSTLLAEWQDTVSDNWKRYEVDVTEFLTNSASDTEWRLEISAMENFVNKTWWYIDGVSVQVCSAALNPTVTPSPTPPYAWGSGCRQVVPNDGFEDELAGWKISGVDADVVAGGSGSSKSFRGAKHLYVRPKLNTNVLITSVDLPSVPTDRLQSAMATFAVRGMTTDVLEDNDTLRMDLEPIKPIECPLLCNLMIGRFTNTDMPTSWKLITKDVADFITDPRWRFWNVEVFAKQSILEATGWDIDSVGVNVCLR